MDYWGKFISFGAAYLLGANSRYKLLNSQIASDDQQLQTVGLWICKHLVISAHQLRTVLVENLPEDHTIENLKKIFCQAGTIKKITIHEENVTRDTRKCSIEEKLLSSKLYASLEYETVEAAEKAVTL